MDSFVGIFHGCLHEGGRRDARGEDRPGGLDLKLEECSGPARSTNKRYVVRMNIMIVMETTKIITIDKRIANGLIHEKQFHPNTTCI